VSSLFVFNNQPTVITISVESLLPECHTCPGVRYGSMQGSKLSQSPAVLRQPLNCSPTNTHSAGQLVRKVLGFWVFKSLKNLKSLKLLGLKCFYLLCNL